MVTRAWALSHSAWLLAFPCLLFSVLVTAGQNKPMSTKSPPEGRLITVWKVGSPHEGDTPDPTISPTLEQTAEKMGLKLIVRPFPAVGFARQFFEAFKKGREPDILAFNNYGILNGITTPLGDFSGIASDETVRKQLVEVTESLAGLEGHISYSTGRSRGWEFLVTSSEHSKAARLLAVRSPECSPRWHLAPLTQDLQESVIPIARAYLQGDSKSLVALEDRERLHTDVENPRQLDVLEIRGCGYWGDERLAFVPMVSSYESPKAVGQISLLLILRKHNTQWQMLAASTDPQSVYRFPEGIPKLISLLEESRSPGRKPRRAKLVAPKDGQSPVPAQGQRFGNFVWKRSKSRDVVAQIVEFAYNDDARLFLRFSSGNTHANDQMSDGQLWTTRGLWRWRIWSISDSGAISFSKARSFIH